MTKVNVRKEFGATVRAHRLRLGLSQEALAERAQLHRTYVTDVERGARNISLESISRLAGALDLSISTLFPPSRASSAAGGRSSGQAPGDVEILLVEDDDADLELTLAAFNAARLSNHIEVVRDGAAALDFLFRQGAYADRRLEEGPLVVLLDLHLPKVHGLEVLQRLRDNERTRSLRVVVLTNSRQNNDVRQALRLGAQAYIVKPLDFHALSSVTPQLDCYWTLLKPPESAGGLRRTSLKS